MATKSADGTWALPQVRKVEGLHATSIEWCDYSMNPLRAVNIETGKVGWSCTKVAPGCANCYAEAINLRYGNGLAFTAKNEKQFEFIVDHRRLDAMMRAPVKGPFKNQRSRAAVFPCDMTDIFHRKVSPGQQAQIFGAMVARRDFDFLVLTKRPAVAAARLDDWIGPRSGESEIIGDLAWSHRDIVLNRRCRDDCYQWPADNIWMGTSIAKDKDLRFADDLIKVPAAVRFLSLEPWLGPISFTEGDQTVLKRALDYFGMAWSESNCRFERLKDAKIHMVIIGCESNGNRVGNLGDFKTEAAWIEAAERMVLELRLLKVCAFVKQIPMSGKVCGDVSKFPESLRVRQMPGQVQ